MRIGNFSLGGWWSTAQISAKPDHHGRYYGYDEGTKRALVITYDGTRWVEVRG